MEKHPESGAGHLSPLLKQSSDITAVRGEGVWLYDDSGERYLDFTSGIGVTSTGHCHPKVVEAAQRQVANLIHGQYAIVRHQPLVELAGRLGEKMPDPISAFFFASAGTEAIEAAMRLSRHATGRPNFIAFQGGFHGRTMGSLSMTSSSVGLRAGLQPMMGGVVYAPFPDTDRYGWEEDAAADFCLRELDHVLATVSTPRETAAMFIEPIQGEAGYIPASARFMQGLRERCDQHGILLVMDEVQAGFGRTGKFWGHQHFGVEPDVVVTAKGLASGFPLSAFGTSPSLMEQGWPGSQGGTYGGNAVACAAALATMDVMEEEGLVENAAEQGTHLLARLEQLRNQYPEIGVVRGRGLMLGTGIVDGDGKPDGERAARIVKEAERRNLLLIRCGAYGGQVIRWLPPLIVQHSQIDQAIDTFEQALSAAR
ncbi:aspartate aminotransferase family protein [Thiohalomonas denitrificans]|uniref:4-aminobutyrate aminotransferase n=1 Tax=Thiohalomonas denitrificans TaxID=415747 RepID=A0A1G5PV79_9GAMM|nr:aminotransferase class III-fold pyridoxal phosphate-dependent enzyme [Thiohalomonas denitrificans]SCZ53535.1 4-aminobutyrate aminotransferase [Thiohalomonas denitrificans]